MTLLVTSKWSWSKTIQFSSHQTLAYASSFTINRENNDVLMFPQAYWFDNNQETNWKWRHTYHCWISARVNVDALQRPNVQQEWLSRFQNGLWNAPRRERSHGGNMHMLLSICFMKANSHYWRAGSNRIALWNSQFVSVNILLTCVVCPMPTAFVDGCCWVAPHWQKNALPCNLTRQCAHLYLNTMCASL